MIIKTERYKLLCDCGKVGPSASSPKKAMQAARKKGWDAAGDVCPKCLPKKKK